MQEELVQIRDLRERAFGAEIKANNHPYICMEDYVLKNGIEFTSQKLTKEERKIVTEAIDKAGIEFEMRQCFFNSQILAIRDPSRSLTYVEGYCKTTFFPFLHGWVEINGKVIDMTLRHHSQPGGFPVLGTYQDRKYIGCRFPREIVVERVLALEEGGSFLDDMMGNFPLLTGELEINHTKLKVLKGGYGHRRKKKRGSRREV